MLRPYKAPALEGGRYNGKKSAGTEARPLQGK
jgi:hypothetical protein